MMTYFGYLERCFNALLAGGVCSAAKRNMEAYLSVSMPS